jgi:signal transduction histidine kinase/CheY-like chemotaxis protein
VTAALEPRETRLLLLAPTSRDAELACAVLSDSAVQCHVCADLGALCRELQSGAGAVLLAEEALAEGAEPPLAAFVAGQPPWSDLPLLVLTRAGADSPAVAHAQLALGNVTLLERPIRVAALVSAVRSALRARLRQYEIRTQLVERERAAQALREADRRKDEFLATLAHELRNPLAPIRSSLAVLRLTGPRDPATERVYEILERQVNHLVRLVDDLMEVSRITRGKIELRRERVELASVVQAAVETSRPIFEAASHTLAVSLPAQPLLLDADPVRLAQVFANLLNNAAKYTDAGGRITVTAAAQPPGRVTVTVADNGVGIPADVLPQVFDMFTQGDRSLGRAQGGLGIGLTLVRTLVRLHGGDVQAASAGLGRGSEFRVTLPLAAETSRPAKPVEAGGRTGATPLGRVLVVDDNLDAAESLAFVLQRSGADAQLASSGTEALALLDDRRPDVAIIDIGMPGMDGCELARRVRAREELRDVVLVALTGWGQEEDRRRSREAGFDHHLVKPVDVDTLRRLLASLQPRSAEHI